VVTVQDDIGRRFEVRERLGNSGKGCQTGPRKPTELPLPGFAHVDQKRRSTAALQSRELGRGNSPRHHGPEVAGRRVERWGGCVMGSGWSGALIGRKHLAPSSCLALGIYAPVHLSDTRADTYTSFPLLECLLLLVAQAREGKLVVGGRHVESLSQFDGRCDNETRSLALHQTLAAHSGKDERHGFTRRADQFAEQAIACRAEYDPAVFPGECIVAGQSDQRRDETLLYTERRQLTQSVEECGPFCHQLVEEPQRMLWLFSHKCAESGRAEKECFACVVGARVCRVPRSRGETFGTEALTRRSNPRDESAASPNAASENDAAARDDEDPVGGGTALIDRESCGPRRSGRVGREPLALRLRQPREPYCHCVHHNHPHIAQRGDEVAMSGPLATDSDWFSVGQQHGPHGYRTARSPARARARIGRA
jgi:hypothetical protein